MAYKGKFSCKNPSKYLGDPTKIRWRSLWERKFMDWCDSNSSVIQWSSEETIIPYFCTLDERIHRYFPDFLIKIKDKDGKIKTKLVEIKPAKQTIEPKKPKKISKSYIKEVHNWIINSCKWKAAKEFCIKQNIDFIILTENELFKKPL